MNSVLEARVARMASIANVRQLLVKHGSINFDSMGSLFTAVADNAETDCLVDEYFERSTK